MGLVETDKGQGKRKHTAELSFASMKEEIKHFKHAIYVTNGSLPCIELDFIPLKKLNVQYVYATYM